MKLKMGDYNELEVLRKTDYAYILGDQETEVFLHQKQVTKSLEIGETITVFLYYDNQKRVTATMNKPYIDQTHAAFVEVVDVHPKLGAFLNIGLQKDLLLSRDDLPYMKKEWPQSGDLIFATVRTSKNQLTAKLISRHEIKNHLQPTTPLEEGQRYDAYNIYKAEEGNVFFTQEGHYIYVYFKHTRKTYRLGEKESIKITLDKGEFEYNGIIIEQKEKMISGDAERIYQYLLNKNGTMPYGDGTETTVIGEVFNMSKGAFKRALGSMYKQHMIELEPHKTTLLKSLNKD